MRCVLIRYHEIALKKVLADPEFQRSYPQFRKLIRGGPVRLVIHEPVSTSGLTQNDIGDLRDRVRGVVEESYLALRS